MYLHDTMQSIKYFLTKITLKNSLNGRNISKTAVGMIDKESKIKEKKKLILEALKNCLMKDVYSNITVQQVATEAGFSKGGLLHYYNSKEEMYADLIKELFEEIKYEHERLLRGEIQSKVKVSLSALYGIEKFFIDKKTTRIFINIILYAYENEKIMKEIQKFVRENFDLYKNIIKDSRKEIPARRKNDMSPEVLARIAQIIVISAGLIESIDPIDFDHTNLVQYVIAMMKG